MYQIIVKLIKNVLYFQICKNMIEKQVKPSKSGYGILVLLFIDFTFVNHVLKSHKWAKVILYYYVKIVLEN